MPARRNRNFTLGRLAPNILCYLENVRCFIRRNVETACENTDVVRFVHRFFFCIHPIGSRLRVLFFDPSKNSQIRPHSADAVEKRPSIGGRFFFFFFFERDLSFGRKPRDKHVKAVRQTYVSFAGPIFGVFFLPLCPGYGRRLGGGTYLLHLHPARSTRF